MGTKGTEFSVNSVIFRKKIEVDGFEINLEDINGPIKVDLRYLSENAARTIMNQHKVDFNKPTSKKTMAASRAMAKKALRGWNITWGQFKLLSFFSFDKDVKDPPKDSETIPFKPQYINMVLNAAEEFTTQVVIACQEKSNFRNIEIAKN